MTPQKSKTKLRLIDSQNLNLARKKLAFKHGFRKFPSGLRTINVDKAFMFIGYMAEK